jgi:hypothetical protein
MSSTRRRPRRIRFPGLLVALTLTVAGTLAGPGVTAPVAAVDSTEGAADELLDLVAAGDLDGLDALPEVPG